MDWKIELLAVPVSDIDRSIEFYVNKLGFVLDVDRTVDETLRFVQITPPGSACSIVLDKGMSNRDIAAELEISEHTVKVHLWRLFRRLGVKSRTQALHHARSHGLLSGSM